MTTGASTEPPAKPPALPELARMLREVTGQSQAWAVQITPATRLEDDLGLESAELAALADLLRRHPGGSDLPAYLAGLDVDQLIALTVGDLLTALAGPEPEPAR